MPKQHNKFICQQCNTSFTKWTGKCEQCGAWNSLVESLDTAEGKAIISRSKGKVLSFTPLDKVSVEVIKNRISSGVGDIDIVLGGGLMPGSVLLVSGEPGIGKSTLLLQVALFISSSRKVLYVSGEESMGQVKLRADRLAGDQEHSGDLALVSSTSADDIAATIHKSQFNLVIVDSIQTLTMAEISSAPGTVSQITNATNLIIQAAKKSNTTVILVGHVTKDGAIAGPKVMEHMVDVVVQFEGDKYGGFKLLRAIKNRFGSTTEVAILEMYNNGLRVVDNPSAHLLAERSHDDGSIVLATMEGNRPLLVEVQALVNTTSFGYPKRTASGIDINRMNLLVAVLEKRTKLRLHDKDIFVNVVGGLRIVDPAADLALCMAIASAAASRRLDEKAVVFGEIGLGGELRRARYSDKRIQEAKKLGFQYAIAPSLERKNEFVRHESDLRSVLRKYLSR